MTDNEMRTLERAASMGNERAAGRLDAALARMNEERSPVSLNGITVRRASTPGTIHVPLPRELWRAIEGGCSCSYCSADGKPAPAYWDTMNVSTRKRAKSADTTWTVHYPELHGARPKR